ncbi:hypothetical protein E4U41_004519 [Claviceps citrina]|nr:hypothetical protein E4U41_004519 [Claviceps citrina]
MTRTRITNAEAVRLLLSLPGEEPFGLSLGRQSRRLLLNSLRRQEREQQSVAVAVEKRLPMFPHSTVWSNPEQFWPMGLQSRCQSRNREQPCQDLCASLQALDIEGTVLGRFTAISLFILHWRVNLSPRMQPTFLDRTLRHLGIEAHDEFPRALMSQGRRIFTLCEIQGFSALVDTDSKFDSLQTWIDDKTKHIAFWKLFTRHFAKSRPVEREHSDYDRSLTDLSMRLLLWHQNMFLHPQTSSSLTRPPTSSPQSNFTIVESVPPCAGEIGLGGTTSLLPASGVMPAPCPGSYVAHGLNSIFAAPMMIGMGNMTGVDDFTNGDRGHGSFEWSQSHYADANINTDDGIFNDEQIGLQPIKWVFKNMI